MLSDRRRGTRQPRLGGRLRCTRECPRPAARAPDTLGRRVHAMAELMRPLNDVVTRLHVGQPAVESAYPRPRRQLMGVCWSRRPDIELGGGIAVPPPKTTPSRVSRQWGSLARDSSTA